MSNFFLAHVAMHYVRHKTSEMTAKNPTVRMDLFKNSHIGFKKLSESTWETNDPQQRSRIFGKSTRCH